jgi:hypothetical protein
MITASVDIDCDAALGEMPTQFPDIDVHPASAADARLGER